MNDNFKEKFLEKLKSAKIKMHSRWYFISKKLVLVIIIVAAALVILFIDSFIFFTMEKSALWYLPGFGLTGLLIMFVNLPWLLIGIVVALLIILEYLITRYAFAYRRPILYSALGLLIVITAVSYAIKVSSFHEQIDNQVQAGKMPMAKPLYQKMGVPKPKDVNPGVIINIDQDGFQIQRPDGCPFMVKMTEQTRLPRNYIINDGDYVLIIGRTNDGFITAEAIRRAPVRLFRQVITMPPPVEYCNKMK